MGKKGSWLSTIKGVFVHNTKEKQNNELESKNRKEPKKKIRALRRGDKKSFIPVFREPSSIEKILGEIDEQKLFSRPSTLFEQHNAPSLPTPRRSSIKPASPRATSPRVSSPRGYSQRVPSPKASSSRDFNRHKEAICYRPEPTLQYRHLSATKIQSGYRGYMARRSFRALRGLVRLQGVIRGQNVKCQTSNTMKIMQQLVRVQTQLHSRRMHVLENRALQQWTISQACGQTNELSEAGNQDWDDSTLTIEEIEARMLKKMEAALKRERTLAYAYSNQSHKSNPKSAQVSVPDVRPSGFPWWRWLERQHPVTNNSPNSQPTRNSNLTPSRCTPEPKPSPRPSSTYKPPYHIGHDTYEGTTPTSTRSMAPLGSKHFMLTPTQKKNQHLPQGSTACKTPLRQSPGIFKFPKKKPSSTTSVKEDDSLMSCNLIPNYMIPTASAAAKASNRFPGTPENDSKKRFPFPLTPNIRPFKWKKGTSNTDLSSKKMLEKHQYHSADDSSIDSAMSVPADVGRKAFNRFV